MSLLQKIRTSLVIGVLAVWVGMHPPANALWQAVPRENPSQVLLQPPVELAESVTIPVRVDGAVDVLAELTASSILISDLHSGTVMFAKNPDMPVPPASTTKIMTALVASELLGMDDQERNQEDSQSGSDSTNWITIEQSTEVVGQSLKLAQPDSFSPDDMLKILLISSGNDAALALARQHPQGYGGFVNSMNEKVDQLGLTSTQFRNPSGLPQEGHTSSSRDMLLMARALLQNDWAREIVGQASAVVRGQSDRQYVIVSTNQLLTQPGRHPVNAGVQIKGIKTGWTEEAGECLITLAEIDGQEVVIVILGSEDRFGETATLLNWIQANHRWVELPITRFPDES